MSFKRCYIQAPASKRRIISYSLLQPWNSYVNNSEIKNLVKGSVSIFGKPFVKDKTIQKIQGQFDANKDGIVSEKEIDAFLKNKYNMKLEDAKKMNVKKFVDTLQAKDEARKKAEKK